MDIIAMERSETPTFPYRSIGTREHKNSPWTQVPWINRLTANGNTITQNSRSEIHKLKQK